MTDRDWERELAEIDRRLASIPEAPEAEVAAGDGARTAGASQRPIAAPSAAAGAPPRSAAPVAPTVVAATPGARAAAAPKPIGAAPQTAAPAPRGWRQRFALLFRVLLGVALAAVLAYWPYETRCGIALGYYLGVVGALALVGVTTSAAAWRHRSALVHLLGLGFVVGAGVLAAREVLPKVGYAYPTPERPVAWTCG